MTTDRLPIGAPAAHSLLGGWSQRVRGWDDVGGRWVAATAFPRWAAVLLHAATPLGGAGVTLLFPAALLWWPATAGVGRAALLANVLSHVVVQVLKRVVSRSRPDGWGTPREVPPDPYSFPSGHATAATAISTPLLLSGHPLGLGAVALAILVGVSRVYRRVHYPSDVLAGYLLGLLAAGWALKVLVL